MRDRRVRFVATLAIVLTASALNVAPAVAVDEEAQYFLPAAEGTALIVTQGNRERLRRSDNERYAFDFAANDGPADFEVVAARGGTVLSQRAGVRNGRCVDPPRRRPDCWRVVNHVLIDHGDGTSGLYMHLERGEPFVRQGEVVSRGQPIGLAGRSGWTEETGVQFQLQPTPKWNDWGRGDWFQTESLPVSFSDSSVLDLYPDGVPETDDLVISGNAPAAYEPFRFRRRSVDLPATLPLEIGEPRLVSHAYDADSVDGYGLSFALSANPERVLADPDETDSDTLEPAIPEPGTIVRPLFGGELVYAGCATGASTSLGRTVIVRRDLDDDAYYAVLGHLSEIEPSLLDKDPDIPLELGANELLGRYGVILAPGQEPALSCPDAEPEAVDLYAGILLDASVSSDGEITGGTPISPEPFVGRGAYEGFDWWSGPVTAASIDEDPGRPRVNWTRRTPRHASHVAYGDPVRLVVRARDAADIREVRFRVYYSRWPRVGDSRDLNGFDPTRTWRQVAVCRPPGSGGEPRRTRGCQWDGDEGDAIVTYSWDPTASEPEAAAPWLPSARTALSRASRACVPVSLGVEVVDRAGHVRSNIGSLPIPERCDQRAIDRSDGRVVYLDPLTPPLAPVNRGRTNVDRPFPYNVEVYGPDPLNGYVAWRDRAENEDGYYMYVRRNWLRADCSLASGPYVRVATLPPNSKRYQPRHQRNLRSAPAPDIPDVPGYMTRYRIYASAFNKAGESRRTLLGAFIAGGEGFCDRGLEGPPPLDGL
jgi:hypothetical protein